MGMTWQFSTWPVSPQYWRATPADLSPYDEHVVMPMRLVLLHVTCGVT
jgi:hypothetical protein